MVGLADIPCVGKFVDRLSEATVDAVFRSLKYMFCYKALVDDLNSETGKLNIEKDEMSRKIREEKANGKEILGHISKWQIDVEEIQKSAEELSPSSCSCIQRLSIPNPVSRFRIGRNAAKKAKTVAQLKESGKEYLTGEIAYFPPVIYMPKSDTTFEEFPSRKDVYNKLWDALVDEDSHLIHGIYGMAGVGKTRMMEQFWEESLKKKIFNKAVRVNVGSENTDKRKLQEQIAGFLDCKMGSEVVESRASQLENSLRNGGKFLLILDDVWMKIPLKDIIGDPFADGSSSSKGSKILFTSRKKEVCLNNECKHVVEIETLSPDEAMYLFEKTVGPDSINSLPNQSLVKEVCNKCGRLPLLIHAVGKALKGKPHYMWKDAHDQLKKGKFEEIADVDPQVYTGIKLSIDYLQNDDAKSCLFLCSMFPEDANIDMKMLIQLATGSQLIPDGESRVLAMVAYLKISSLLLDSGNDDETKVHDIIRNVARSIAFTDSKYAFIQVICSSQNLPSNVNYCTRRFLRLDAEIANVHFNEHLVCPDMHTLWLQSNDHPQQFSRGFISMFGNLSCLMLQKVNIHLEQFSLQPLNNLGTLSLLKCDIRKTDGSLFPKSLESLCIYECKLPLPLDVANLKCLRKLEIQEERPVLVMENVLSSLSSLEELHISRGFIHSSGKYHLEPIVMEISELTRLTSLHFEFYEDVHNTLQGTDIFSNIDGYNIFVGTNETSEFRRDWKVPLTRSIELRGNHSKPWQGLIARAEEVVLRQSDVEVSSICRGHRRAFEELKRLSIYGCHKMKYLFCNNTAKSMLQLQELSVKWCESMEAIIMNEGTSDGRIINFPKLNSLLISQIPRLASFYADKSANLTAQYQPLFNGMVAFPSLKKLDIRQLPTTSDIWGNECYNDTVSSFCELTLLDVSFCDKLEIVIPQDMLPRLHDLKHISVYSCNRLRTIFPASVVGYLKYLKELSVQCCEKIRDIIEAGEQVISDVILFPELTNLTLSELQKLKSFWCYQTGIANTCKVPLRLPQLSSIFLDDLPELKSFFHGSNFEFHVPALKQVMVYTCGLSTLFTFSMFRSFQLENLIVHNCGLLENVVEDLRGDESCDNIITLSQLTKVDLSRLPELKSFSYGANYEFHMPVLKKVEVFHCGLSNALFTRSIFENLKQLEELCVSHCELLEGIFEDAREDETLDMSDNIITLNRVSTVHLEGLPKFKRIFYGATYKCYMPALKNVKIFACELSVLFTCSVFREFKQLEELHVSYCSAMEHIVEEVGGDESSEMNGKSITFNQLSSITLDFLPKLKSFSCTSSYVFNMPKLQYLKLFKCPRIEYFSSSKMNPSSVHFISDWHSKERFQDLNDFIEQYHKNGEAT